MPKIRSLFSGLFFIGTLLVLPAAFAATVSPAQLTGALYWRSVGPYTGGRVTTVAGIASEPNVFYMGTASGGVWESDNYGYSWRPITDRYFKPETSGSVGALAIAPSNPKIIYVGTGDSAPRNTVTPGHGMYKSTDGGRTWSYIGLGNTHIISWINVDPNNPDVVYVAALGHLFGPNPERGVFKTTDGGRSWTKVLYVNDQTGAITMAMDPKDPQVVYAAMWQMTRRAWTFSSGGPGSGIYKTTDGGAHWTNITHNEGLPSGIFGKVGVAVAPSDPNVVYALIQADYKGQAGGLFQSDDAGRTWKLVNNSMDITQRAFYYSRVYVDPVDANTIYLPNVEAYVSHDGGKKLVVLHLPDGDNHAFWINPADPQIIIEGNDNGATITRDGGKTWSTENNQPTGQFYHVNLDDQFPFRIYGSQQDGGSVVAASAVLDGGIPPVWRNVVAGEMSWVVPQPGSPWITYGSGYYSKEWKDNRRTGLFTNVSPWAEYKFGLKGAAIKYRFGWWHHPVVFALGDPNELLIGSNVVFESKDAGLRWAVISPDLTRNDKSKQQRPGGPISADVTGEEMYDTLSAIAVSPLDHNVIWTGSDDGLVYMTADGGGHWMAARPSELPAWSTITSIELSASAAGTAYISADRYMWDDFKPYVYVTTDYGKHWTAITKGLPDNEYVEAVRQDPNDPELMFAATSATVYMSLDGGKHWQPLTLNLPTVPVTDLEIQPEQHAVVISTFGRAYWVLDNLQFLEQLSAAKVVDNVAYLFKPQQTWLVTRGGGRSGLVNQGHDGYSDQPRLAGKNLLPGATVFFYLPSDYNGKGSVKLSFTDASGMLINSFTFPTKLTQVGSPVAEASSRHSELHAGMNRFLWNLRYPNAVDVTGIYHSDLSAGLPIGPEVVPGTYYVVLTYDEHTERQPFAIDLDPRLSTTQAELQQRFDLLMQLHDALSRLDSALNQAIGVRSALEKAIADRRVSGSLARQFVVNLNDDINGFVDLKIQSDEGGLVYPPRLRAWLTSIAGQVGIAFVPPTQAMMQAAGTYIGQASEAVKRLRSDVANADAVLHR